MTDKLLPCPFCGGEAEVVDFYSVGMRKNRWVVMCHNCKGGVGDIDSKEEAVETWNNRWMIPCEKGETDGNWHTGTPTEEGEYVVFCQYRKDDGKLRKYKTVFEFKNGKWTKLPALEGNLDEYELIAWYGQKIEPYEEEK